jgi:hypothetical protein
MRVQCLPGHDAETQRHADGRHTVTLADVGPGSRYSFVLDADEGWYGGTGLNRLPSVLSGGTVNTLRLAPFHFALYHRQPGS